MKFHVVTLFPDLIEEALKWGVIGQGFKSGKLKLEVYNPRIQTKNVHQTVDDRPYGGGDGMIMLAEPIQKTLDGLYLSKNHKRFYMSPKGRVFDNEMANELSHCEELVLVCGRYGGIDERVLISSDLEEVSVGDYILSGGEFAALTVIDSVSRYVPGVVQNNQSPYNDSFSNGLLEAPQFTRPNEYKGMEVPSILLSGDHKSIEIWRMNLGLLLTLDRRPDLLGNFKREDLEEAWRVFERMKDSEKRSLRFITDLKELKCRISQLD